MDHDGNLKIENIIPSINITWQTNTASSITNLKPYKLKLENEGSIIIINGLGKTIWSSNNNSKIGKFSLIKNVP
jgi:hypothetical protein